MHKPVVAFVLSLLAVALLVTPGLAKLEKAEMTTAAVIQDAFDRGQISHDEMILQKAYALYAPFKLREDFVGGRIDKCGVPMADEIFRALPDLPDEVADEIRGLRARPVNMTSVTTEHFRIHYDTSGTHMIKGWPNTAYRDAVMAAAENVYAQEVTALGFRCPGNDIGDPDGGGGCERYDIYVQNLGTGLYGYCQATYYTSDPSYPVNAANSYVVIDNDYLGFGYTDATLPMKVTVAHEFNHACQGAHDVGEPTWYKECTAVWAEEQVYDEINDYIQYMSSFLNSLYRSIDYCTDSMRWYGSAVWNFFLSEYYDPSIVVENWWQMESSGPTLDMMNVVLLTHGSSMEEAYENFAIWCWFTGTRSDGQHFEEAATWITTPIMRGHNSYPIAIGGPTPGWEPDHYGCNYIQFNNPGGGYTGLLVSFDGPQLLTVANCAFINYKDTGGHYHEYGGIPLNPWGIGELTVQGWDGMQYAGLVVANCSSSANDMNYSYNAEQVDTGASEDVYAFGLKAASPNPFAGSTSIAYSVPTGGGLVDIVIYDVNGREVRQLVNQPMEAGAGNAVWDGLDNAGQRVASGVYFARLDIDGLTASGKLIMLK